MFTSREFITEKKKKNIFLRFFDAINFHLKLAPSAIVLGENRFKRRVETKRGPDKNLIRRREKKKEHAQMTSVGIFNVCD
jgi:hypothetical protein